MLRSIVTCRNCGQRGEIYGTDPVTLEVPKLCPTCRKKTA